jgi:hypothetical protein
MKLSWIKLQIKDKIFVLSVSRKIMKEKKKKKKDGSLTR